MTSHGAMLRGLMRVSSAAPIHTHVLWQSFQYLWEMDSGEVHRIPQGEGGEQGDPMMPLFHCLWAGNRPAVCDILERIARTVNRRAKCGGGPSCPQWNKARRLRGPTSGSSCGRATHLTGAHTQGPRCAQCMVVVALRISMGELPALFSAPEHHVRIRGRA